MIARDLCGARCPMVSAEAVRLALLRCFILFERGLTEKQLAKYWVSRRKNSKPRFDYEAFAEAQDISPDWIFEGDIRSHPRGTAPRPHQSPPRLTDGDAA